MKGRVWKNAMLLLVCLLVVQLSIGDSIAMAFPPGPTQKNITNCFGVCDNPFCRSRLAIVKIKNNDPQAYYVDFRLETILGTVNYHCFNYDYGYYAFYICRYIDDVGPEYLVYSVYKRDVYPMPLIKKGRVIFRNGEEFSFP